MERMHACEEKAESKQETAETTDGKHMALAAGADDELTERERKGTCILGGSSDSTGFSFGEGKDKFRI